VEQPQGDWTEVSEDPLETTSSKENRGAMLAQRTETQKVTAVKHTRGRDENIHANSDMDGEPFEDDMDGEPLEEDDIDGESLGDEDDLIEGAYGQKSHTDMRSKKSLTDEDFDGDSLDGELLDE
jgi:hypothetical protein